MGRRRYRNGQPADIDEPWCQWMRLGSLVPLLSILGAPGNDMAMPSVMIMAPHGVDMSFMMISMMWTRLVIVVPVRAVPLLIVLTIAAPPVGRSRSAEKHQNHC